MVDEQTDDAFPPLEQPQPRWCVVGNVVAERLHGEHGEQRPGSKLFKGGTRVYFQSAWWGVGGEAVTVLGLGRRPRRWITTTLRTSLIENWRATLVYTPRVLQELEADAPDDEDEARDLAVRMNRISAASNWRLVPRTAPECRQAALASAARILTSTSGDDEQDQAFILYRGVEAVAGLVYRAAPADMNAPHAALFTCSHLWLRPFAELYEVGTVRPPGSPDEVVSALSAELRSRFYWHDLGALLERMRTPAPS